MSSEDQIRFKAIDRARREVQEEQARQTEAHRKSEMAEAQKHEEAMRNKEERMQRPVSLDLNLVKNLLASYDAQDGFSGPVSNMLSSMGLSLPDSSDPKEDGQVV